VVTSIRMRHAVDDFLDDLARRGKSPNTIRAYRADLADFTHFHTAPPHAITAKTLRGYLAGLDTLAASTRARREASIASFLAWAHKTELIDADPMTRLDRTRIPVPAPRPVPADRVAAVLGAIPKVKDRDRLLFTLLYSTGMRVSEALAIHVDDLDLTVDDEHVTVTGKGGKYRTVLLDDPALVAMLRRYLGTRRYTHGPLFRAEKNHVGGPLRYASVQELWAKYRAAANVNATIHQLRHAHACELVNAGVSLETIRRRLGHANAQTTLRYADQHDATADSEIRAWRRRQSRNLDHR